jgi:F0F1-type ATP synthase epsilon subunit
MTKDFEGKEQGDAFTKGGYVEVRDDHVRVLADQAE